MKRKSLSSATRDDATPHLSSRESHLPPLTGVQDCRIGTSQITCLIQQHDVCRVWLSWGLRKETVLRAIATHPHHPATAIPPIPPAAIPPPPPPAATLPPIPLLATGLIGGEREDGPRVAPTLTPTPTPTPTLTTPTPTPARTRHIVSASNRLPSSDLPG